MKTLRQYVVNGGLYAGDGKTPAAVGDQVRLYLDTEAHSDFPEYIIGTIQHPVAPILAGTAISYSFEYNEADLEDVVANLIVADVISVTVTSAVDIVAEELDSHIGAGGAAHANVIAAGAAGFMTGADKTKLDAISGTNTGDETTESVLALWNGQYEFYPESYGAVGDGTTDDSAAFTTMLADIPARGGVVCLAAKTYKANFTLDKQIKIKGQGSGFVDMGDWPSDQVLEGGASRILSTSLTADCITITQGGCVIEDVCIINSNATGTRPSAGAGIKASLFSSCHLHRVAINGFYNNVEIVNGHLWSMTNCLILNPKNVGVKYRYDDVPDGGDMSVVGCWFYVSLTGAGAASAAIECNSSGGMKLTNNKFNGANAPEKFADMVKINGLGASATSVLLISNNSFENYTGWGVTIQSEAGYHLVQVIGNEFGVAVNGIRIKEICYGGIVANNIFGSLSGTCIEIDKAQKIRVGTNHTYGSPTYNVLVKAGSPGCHIEPQHINVIPTAVGNAVTVLDVVSPLQNFPTVDYDYSSSFWLQSVASGTDIPFFRISGAAYYGSGLIKLTVVGVLQGVGTAVIIMERAYHAGPTGITVATRGTDTIAGLAAASFAAYFAESAAFVLDCGIRKNSAANFNGTATIEVDGNMEKFLIVGQ